MMHGQKNIKLGFIVVGEIIWL